MDCVILQRRRSAPGRTRNKASSTKSTQESQRAWTTGSSMYRLERPFPAGLIKKMNDHMRQKSQPLAHAPHFVLVFRGYKRPVDKHRPPNDVVPGNEPPVAAVQTAVAVIAHSEIAVRRHHHVAILHVLGQSELPLRSDIAVVHGRYRGKLVAIVIVGKIRVRVLGHQVRFGEFLAVAIDRAIAQMNPVAGYADDPFHNVKLGSGWVSGKKYYDVSAVNLLVGNDRPHPT